MKTAITTAIIITFILMGVGDAMMDNGSITASKIVESIYLGILFIGIAVLVNSITILGRYIKFSIVHYVLCLGILHQSLVNISYGIVRNGIEWWFIGSTSGVDRVLYWFINDALKTNQPHFLMWYYALPSMVAIFVLNRNALNK